MPFFVRVRGKPQGPFTLEQLRELVATQAISAATDFSVDRAGPWQRLDASAHAVLVLGAPREFERVNDPSSAPIELRDLIAAANQPLATAPTARPVSAGEALPPSAPHDVRALRVLNLATEARLGLHELAPPARRVSRRRRDYAVLMAAIGALISIVLVVESYIAVQLQVVVARMPEQFWPILRAVLFHSPIFAWGLAAFFTYAIALAWLMFVVMDDY